VRLKAIRGNASSATVQHGDDGVSLGVGRCVRQI
jgi:hypothetical protein